MLQSSTNFKDNKKIKDYILVGCLIVVFLFLAFILQNFITTLVAAAVISVWLAPIFIRCIAVFPKKGLVAGFLVVGFVLFFLLPITAITTLSLSQLQEFLVDARQQLNDPENRLKLETTLQTILSWFGMSKAEALLLMQNTFKQTLGDIITLITAHLRQIASVIALTSLQVFILLFAIYSFLVSGEQIIQFFRRLSPLDSELELRLIEIFRSFSRSIVLGGFVTAIIQGVVAGFSYALVGIDHALFWATLTIVFSFIPIVGTALIWLPMVGWLWLEGSTGAAIFLLIYNSTLTVGIDNFLRPFLMGKGSRLHPLILFLTIFGGVLVLGPVGVLLGPISASFFLALAEIYMMKQVAAKEMNTTT